MIYYLDICKLYYLFLFLSPWDRAVLEMAFDGSADVPDVDEEGVVAVDGVELVVGDRDARGPEMGGDLLLLPAREEGVRLHPDDEGVGLHSAQAYS